MPTLKHVHLALWNLTYFVAFRKLWNAENFSLIPLTILELQLLKMHRLYNKLLKMYLERYKWAIITYFILQCCCIKYCTKVLFLKRMLSYLADLWLNCMSITMYCHIYNFGFVNENNNIFLSNDHIWNNRNLDSHIIQTHSDISFKLSGFYIFIDCFKMIDDWQPNL